MSMHFLKKTGSLFHFTWPPHVDAASSQGSPSGMKKVSGSAWRITGGPTLRVKTQLRGKLEYCRILKTLWMAQKFVFTCFHNLDFMMDHVDHLDLFLEVGHPQIYWNAGCSIVGLAHATVEFWPGPNLDHASVFGVTGSVWTGSVWTPLLLPWGPIFCC